MAEKISFKSFLSHRYKSPEVNLYFFKLFDDEAEVQFEVDEGTFNTNVTRLERMVRDADAFIGIYPFPGTSEDSLNPDELKKQSRYFRLEIDLAIRSQKPAIIFFDKRYSDIIKPPPTILSSTFDPNEILGTGGFPQSGRHKRVFNEFCDLVRIKKDYDNFALSTEKTRIGLIIPDHKNCNGYTNICIENLKSILANHIYTDVRLINWPPVLDKNTFSLFEKLDMAIVDMGDQVALSGIAAYLHGKFIPMIRLKYVSNENSHINLDTFYNFLFGGVEVGYMKDMLLWSDFETLEQGFKQKLNIIKAPVKRINTNDDAIQYFRSAALRKEAVFISYSGKDEDVGANFSTVFKKYFQTVFDYKDGKSIRLGQPWIQEIFEKLSASSIGIQLLSKSYLDSGNCMHEAQQMVAQSDSGKIRLFAIKIKDETLELPSFLSMLQYAKYKNGNIDEIAKEIISQLIEKDKNLPK